MPCSASLSCFKLASWQGCLVHFHVGEGGTFTVCCQVDEEVTGWVTGSGNWVGLISINAALQQFSGGCELLQKSKDSCLEFLRDVLLSCHGGQTSAPVTVTRLSCLTLWHSCTQYNWPSCMIQQYCYKSWAQPRENIVRCLTVCKWCCLASTAEDL